MDTKITEIRRNFKIGDYELTNFINLNTADKQKILVMRNNEKVRKCVFNQNLITEQQHFGFINNLDKDKANYYWLVKKESVCLGVISLNKLDFENKNSYLGIYKNFELENTKGIGKILLKNLLKIAFDEFNLHTLKLEVFQTNEFAIKLYESCGFIEEGRLQEFVYRDDKWQDVIIMGLLNKGNSTNEY